MPDAPPPSPPPSAARDPAGAAGEVAAGRVFLLLQGPHGPFFDRLGALLRAAGAQVWRAGFNAGDAFFWSDAAHYIPHARPAADWPAHLDRLIDAKGVTDIVLYGDVRPVHAAARAAAARQGLTLHVFEEGYLRPWWITYERGGSNGHSPLITMDIAEMARLLAGRASDTPRPPSHWGDTRQHKVYGALYHFLVLVANRRYPGFRNHRAISLGREFRLNLRRLLLGPVLAARRAVLTRRLRRSGHPYALVLLQLAHDSSVLAHSDHPDLADFVDQVMAGFTAAPAHHHLVFKAHPLEDDRVGLGGLIRAAAARHGLAGRVHLLPGGKVAGLMAAARAVVTINSTAAQQALWRGLPVRATGRAVYGKPELVSAQPLAAFFRDPVGPDAAAYRVFRSFLLETSQIPGGFYSAQGRADALRVVVDLMLDPDDPYAALAKGRPARRPLPGAGED